MEVLQRTANRGSISDGGYEIDNSVKMEADNTEYMHYTPSGQTDYERMAFSVWIKRTELSTTQLIMEFGNGTANTSNLRIGFDTSDRLFCYGNSIIWRQTNQVFRDTSSWYHLFFLFDTTTPGGVSNNRIRIWVNGEMIDHTDFGTINNPSAGAAMGFNNSLKQSLGRQSEDTTNYFCGYMAQVYGSGGTPPVVGDFGETDSDTGIWIPKDISDITPPDAAGFNLDFSTSGSLGNDISSRNNDFTLVNITAADQATDTPTNNFCTLNPLYKYDYGNTITEGATKIYGAANNWGGGKATFGLTSGKWYWEIKQLANGNTFMGLQTDGEDNIASGNAQSQNTSVVFYTDGTLQYSNGSESTTSAANSIASNSIVGFALDLDSSTQTIKVYNNNSLVTAFGSSGTANLSTYNLANKTVFPFVALYDRTVNMNFGGYTVSSISSPQSDANGYGTFEYAPPSGYYALCTKNLAEEG